MGISGEDKGYEYICTTDSDANWWQSSPVAPAWIGQVFRLRGIGAYIGSNAVAVVTFILNNFDWKVYTAFLIPSAAVALLIWYARTLMLSMCRAEYQLHWVMHSIRDRLHDITHAENDQAKTRDLKAFYQDTCQQIAEYFKARANDPSLECCIRILDVDDHGARAFVTRARSKGLAPEREKSSVPLPIGKGIAKALLDRGGEGAYRVDDTKKAAAQGVWEPQKNDAFFSDIKSQLICPINGYTPSKRKTDAGETEEVVEKTVLGLIYLTSRSKQVQNIYWEPLKAFADIMGAALPAIYLSDKQTPGPSSDAQPAPATKQPMAAQKPKGRPKKKPS